MDKQFKKSLIFEFSFPKPWTFMEQLDKWMETINQHLTQLQLPLELFDQMKMRSR